MLKPAIYFAMFVGAIVIALWVSREANYFFSGLLSWIKYNWLSALGLVFLGILAYKVVSSKS
jgi:hypothetical protein